MNEHSSVYIGGFSYELGEQEFDLEELVEIQGDPSNIQKLAQMGIKRYRTSEKPVLELAKAAINSFFDKGLTRREEIDGIVFCTNSFWCGREFQEGSLSDFWESLGLGNAYPIASSFSFCGNFLTGARTARNYIKSGDFTNVLLVVADRTAQGVTRVVPPMISIGSDAASCCLLTSQPLTDYEIFPISQSTNARMGQLDPDKDFKAYTQGVAKGVTQNVQKALSHAGIGRKEITGVIPNNYNKWLTPSMVKLAGLSDELVQLDNIPRFAHAGASDICINLSDYTAGLENPKDEYLLLLSTGPAMWGSVVIKGVEKNLTENLSIH